MLLQASLERSKDLECKMIYMNAGFTWCTSKQAVYIKHCSSQNAGSSTLVSTGPSVAAVHRHTAGLEHLPLRQERLNTALKVSKAFHKHWWLPSGRLTTRLACLQVVLTCGEVTTFNSGPHEQGLWVTWSVQALL
jgi:hypothetical protein